jgi:hypothetical protein
MKKKLESDVLDLETALEHANAANAETQVLCSSEDSLHFESVNWNLIAGQLLIMPKLPMMRLQLHLLHFEFIKWNLKAGWLLSMPVPPMLKHRYM